jgi:hypothetical protein
VNSTTDSLSLPSRSAFECSGATSPSLYPCLPAASTAHRPRIGDECLLGLPTRRQCCLASRSARVARPALSWPGSCPPAYRSSRECSNRYSLRDRRFSVPQRVSAVPPAEHCSQYPPPKSKVFILPPPQLWSPPLEPEESSNFDDIDQTRVKWLTHISQYSQECRAHGS